MRNIILNYLCSPVKLKIIYFNLFKFGLLRNNKLTLIQSTVCRNNQKKFYYVRKISDSILITLFSIEKGKISNQHDDKNVLNSFDLFEFCLLRNNGLTVIQ